VLSYATSVDEEQVLLTHSRQTYQLQLNTEKTHTAYREETVPQTCYRQVYAGSVPECRWVTEQICTRDFYGRVWCRPINRQVCYDRPVYRQEPYTCYRTVQIPYEVFDYYVTANVQMNYSQIESQSNNEMGESVINFSLKGDEMSLQGRSTEGLLLYLADRRIETRVEGNHKFLDINYRVQGISKEQYVAPFIGGIRNVRIDGQGLLTFNLGQLLSKEIVALTLTVERRKLGKDELVFHDLLAKSNWSFENTPDGSLVKVTLPQLMTLKSKKKYRLNLRASAPLDRSRLLNAADLGNTEVHTEFKFKF
jgi:hypothetical protein